MIVFIQSWEKNSESNRIRSSHFGDMLGCCFDGFCSFCGRAKGIEDGAEAFILFSSPLLTLK